MSQRWPLWTLLLMACGGSTAAAPSVGSTSGGEQPVERPPPVLPTTTPVPVPAPAVTRTDLSQPLQHFWEEVERMVAMQAPVGPTDGTREAVQVWAEGPFREWMGARREAIGLAVQTSEEVPDEPVYERAMAAGLLAYAIEDMAADVRGSPVPVEIAQDPELLQIYGDNLDEALRPLALQAVQAYAFCATRLRPLGDESEWLPWRAYCVQHGREMVDVYRLFGDAHPAEPTPAP